jgi:CyaY protein
MTESEYQAIADQTFLELEDLFRDVDTESVDCERAGDVMTLSFADGARAVLNTQRPTRQIWLAANARAWHFSWDAGKRAWIDDKGQGTELVAQLRTIVKAKSGLDI